MIADLQSFLFIAQDAEIIRTRDLTQLAECDIVVDVGGEFDPKRHRYDHHQRYDFGSKLLQRDQVYYVSDFNRCLELRLGNIGMFIVTCHGNHIVGLFYYGES